MFVNSNEMNLYQFLLFTEHHCVFLAFLPCIIGTSCPV